MEINYSLLRHSVALPCAVCDAVKLASGDAMRCIVYIFSHPDEEITVPLLARELRITEESTEEALAFWKSLCVIGNGDRTMTQEETDTSNVVPKKASQIFSSAPAKPSRSEIAHRSAEDDSIRFLLQQAELYLGRTLNVSDAGTLIALHDWAGLESNVLLTVVAYCCSKNMTGMRAIQREALRWADAGINTCEKAEEYIRVLEQRDRAVKEVRALLSIPDDRVLKPAEKQAAADWLCVMSLSKELLSEAGRRCLSANGTVKFSAVEKMVLAWKAKGFETLKDVLAAESIAAVPKHGKGRGFTSSDHSFEVSELKVHTPTIPTYKRRGEKS